MRSPVTYALAFCLCLLAYCFTIDAPADATMMNLQGAGCAAPMIEMPTAGCSAPAVPDYTSPAPPPENYKSTSSAGSWSGSYTGSSGSYGYGSTYNAGSSGSYSYGYGSAGSTAYGTYASHGRERIFRRGLFRRGGLFRPATQWNSHSGLFRSSGGRIFNSRGICLNCG